MIERVNPKHPDKIADRIGGAIVDLAYSRDEKAIISGEILIGHNECSIVLETSVHFTKKEIRKIVERIAGQKVKLNLKIVKQEKILAENQADGVKCGDNGIFVGYPKTQEEKLLTTIADLMYYAFDSDGKYLLKDDTLIMCQSNASEEQMNYMEAEIYVDISNYKTSYIRSNPLGEWTGGINVDTGATNRKLGSDMGRSATGGGLHFKDLSKPDVAVNIYAWLKAQITKQKVSLCCAIGDDYVDNRRYSEIVRIAKQYVKELGGFEKFAEWGLIRPKEYDVNLKNYVKYFI